MAAYALLPAIHYLPLMAEFEVFGDQTDANPNEKTYQAQYEYYKSGNSKIKYKQNIVASAASWWFRSPSSRVSNGFCFVFTDGTVDSSYANLSRGAAPVFLV